LTEGYKQTIDINIRVRTNTGNAIDQYFDGKYVKPIKWKTSEGIIAQNRNKKSEPKDTKNRT
jgi:hypothetical protein